MSHAILKKRDLEAQSHSMPYCCVNGHVHLLELRARACALAIRAMRAVMRPSQPRGRERSTFDAINAAPNLEPRFIFCSGQ